MAMSSWPYVAQDTTDVEYGRLYRETAGSDGMAGSYGDGTLAITGDSSGMQVKMAAGSALLRGYMFYNSAGGVVVPIEAPSLANRVDTVCLELNLSAPTIPERILPKVLKGTSGSSTPPGVTQTETGIYQIPLATVAVDAGVAVIAAAKVSSVRTWMDQRYGAWTTNTRPASPRKYKLGFNETTGEWEYYTGAAWVNLRAVDLTSSVVTGTLPISKGGTGQTTAMAALNALGIYPQATAPAYAANRIWLKV